MIINNNRKGQVLAYFLVLSMILLISWAMMINIAKLIRDRMILQNSVDNTTLSIATLQARTLNAIGATNYLMATVLSFASDPHTPDISAILKKLKIDVNIDFGGLMYPSFSTERIAGSMIAGPFSDYKCLPGFYSEQGVRNIKRTVNGIQNIQKSILSAYIAGYADIIANVPADDCKIIVVPSRYAKNWKSFSLKSSNPVALAEQLLGIKKNSKGIKYYGTYNFCVNIAGHRHFVRAQKSRGFKDDKYSWYVQNENFYDKKIVGIGTKLPNADSNRGYPVLGKIIGIKYPPIMAYGSAGVYNVDDAMFPAEENTKTGAELLTVGLMSKMFADQIIVILSVASDIAKIPIVGPPAAIGFGILVGGLYNTETALRVKNALTDDDTLIAEYNRAKYGGWDSHLVPLN